MHGGEVEDERLFKRDPDAGQVATGHDLLLFSGLIDGSDRPSTARVLFVETWFGEGAAEFRVASLHKFALAVQPGPTPQASRVRFALAGQHRFSDQPQKRSHKTVTGSLIR